MTTTRADVDSASTPNAIDTVTDAALERLLVDAGAEPVLLYFTTPWCGPCRVFGPQLNAFVTANPGTVRVVRVDADESPVAADRFRVHAFPTLTMVRAGEQLLLRAGALSEQELTKRKASWKQPPPREKRGVLAKYAKTVNSASEGATTS